MNVTTHVVAPHTQLGRHTELTTTLDALFREYRVPPAIIQHTFTERRPCTHYAEVLSILTPFPTHPSSEFMEDIGRAVSPAQTRIVGLQSAYYPPAFPPIPAAVYAPNEDDYIVARSQLASRPNILPSSAEGAAIETRFESNLVLDSKEGGEITSTLSALFTAKVRDPPFHPQNMPS
jgi:hypothetical protein